MGSTATAEIARMLGSIHDRDHYTVLRDFFELSAISIRNNFDHGPEHANFEKMYMEIAQGYKKEYLEGFAKARNCNFYRKNSRKNAQKRLFEKVSKK